MNVPTSSSTWRILFHLATPYRRQCLVVILLALLGTTAELVEPLIYRTAVNDVAGVFVQRAAEHPQPEASATLGARQRTTSKTSPVAQVQHPAEPRQHKPSAETGKAPPHSSATAKPHRQPT